jgi:hypothetical protein
MFSYFDKEGAIFRVHSSISGAPVDEIWTGTKVGALYR